MVRRNDVARRRLGDGNVAFAILASSSAPSSGSMAPPPTYVAGTSLFFVTANVGSASIAFWWQGRIEKRLAFTMGLLGISEASSERC